MDALVRQAMAKWPDVPDCYGWMGLDMRGQWYMRDDRVQALGPFPQHKGSLLRHDKLIGFIHRNYESDARGCWYFQNGPQRVFVELELTPLVWRLYPDGAVRAHTGAPGQVRQVYLDELGRLYLACDAGFGLIHSADMTLAADFVDSGRWAPIAIEAALLPGRFGYELNPSAKRTG